MFPFRFGGCHKLTCLWHERRTVSPVGETSFGITCVIQFFRISRCESCRRADWELSAEVCPPELQRVRGSGKLHGTVTIVSVSKSKAGVQQILPVCACQIGLTRPIKTFVRSERDTTVRCKMTMMQIRQFLWRLLALGIRGSFPVSRRLSHAVSEQVRNR